MNPMQITSIMVGIILINASLFTIIPLPGIINVLALAVAAFLLLKNTSMGGFIGKINLFLGILIGIFALTGILGYAGINIPFVGYLFRVYTLGLTFGGLLLIGNSFLGG